jgi:signal transduction histidine kinase
MKSNSWSLTQELKRDGRLSPPSTLLNGPDTHVSRWGILQREGADMRLAEFILHDMGVILAEWEAFAATLLPAAAGMTPLALRDHAQHILEAVAKDLTTAQTREAQSEKSKGRAPKVAGAPETAAQTHAVLRARSGFDINQLVAEYRALRASVLRLWIDACPLDQPGVDDVIRFNEAIDQAIAESVGHFHAQVERTRNLLLGMLGHDMRSPLNTILTTASYLAALNAGEQVSVSAARLIRSGAAMQALLDDLVDFNRTKLGLGVKVVPSDIDLAAVVTDELEQLRGAHPNRQIELVATGDSRGRWDGARLQQLVRNLVSNAIRYGSPDTAVRVALHGYEAEVRIEVTNNGPTIGPSALGQIFDPLKQGSAQGDSQDARGGLGLGLFIVREIAAAHDGEVEVRSDGGETTFAVRLPRHNRATSY